MLCNILNVFTVTFDEFNAFFINDSIIFKLLNDIV